MNNSGSLHSSNPNMINKTYSCAQRSEHHDKRATRTLLGVGETSKYLGCTVNTLYSWINQRKVPYIKIGRLVKFDPGDIEIWIAERKVMVREF